VYVAGQVLRKLIQEHPKVQGQQAIAEEKAQVIYRALEAHPATYQIIPDRTVRSRMNICFRIKGGDLEEKAFLEDAAALGLTGLKGHRSVGGIRASNLHHA
jgi:phosphoserine aminotransferase